MTFFWEFDQEEPKITMMIRVNTVFFFAIGFGTGMNSAKDMWIFEANP
jgi:hypothetical protein